LYVVASSRGVTGSSTRAPGTAPSLAASERVAVGVDPAGNGKAAAPWGGADSPATSATLAINGKAAAPWGGADSTAQTAAWAVAYPGPPAHTDPTAAKSTRRNHTRRSLNTASGVISLGRMRILPTAITQPGRHAAPSPGSAGYSAP